jgi:ketosteroid isomerase-like protein
VATGAGLRGEDTQTSARRATPRCGRASSPTVLTKLSCALVVVPFRLTGRGRASGAPFDEDEVHVFRLRNGKIIELREYSEKAEALKAVGLAE